MAAVGAGVVPEGGPPAGVPPATVAPEAGPPPPDAWESLVSIVTVGVPPMLCNAAIKARISWSVSPMGGLLITGMPGLKPGTM